MSRDERSSPALEALIGEAKIHLEPPELDWARLEARVLAEVAEPPRARTPDRPAIAFGVAVLSAAAAFALLTGEPPPPAAPIAVALAPAPVIAEARPAGALRSTKRLGAGERVVISSRSLSVAGEAGQVIRAGDAIEVAGARAVFERDTKVTWLIEPSDPLGEPAHARVTQVGEVEGEPLVVGLDSGAIEAQVTPIPSGEAFAVDVATESGAVRVAVHGTHLRVARSGTSVVVDLTEGVIAIGLPSAGITRGTTVTAPAHVELDARDLGTLKVQTTAVRPPIPLGAAPVPALALAPAPRPPAPAPVPLPVPAPVESVAAPAPVPPPVLPPQVVITRAIRECAASHASRRGEVRVTVTSTLRIKSLPSGGILPMFDPPLPPDIQDCAARVIHATKVDSGFELPIEFTY